MSVYLFRYCYDVSQEEFIFHTLLHQYSLSIGTPLVFRDIKHQHSCFKIVSEYELSEEFNKDNSLLSVRDNEGKRYFLFRLNGKLCKYRAFETYVGVYLEARDEDFNNGSKIGDNQLLLFLKQLSDIKNGDLFFDSVSEAEAMYGLVEPYRILGEYYIQQ